MPSSLLPPEALARLYEAAAGVEEYPASVVLRSLLTESADTHAVDVVLHIVTQWVTRLDGGLAAFPPADTLGLQAIRTRMERERMALGRLLAALRAVRTPVAA